MPLKEDIEKISNLKVAPILNPESNEYTIFCPICATMNPFRPREKKFCIGCKNTLISLKANLSVEAFVFIEKNSPNYDDIDI